MYADPYEKFVHMPIRRTPPPSPVVERERVRPEPVKPDPVKRFRLAGAFGWPANQIEIAADPDQPITLRSLTETVSQHAGVAVADIVGPTRTLACVRARHIVAWLARRFTAKSTTVLVNHLGRRNHTTVLWGVARVSLAIREAGILSPPLNTPRAWTIALWDAEWPPLRDRNPMKLRA